MQNYLELASKILEQGYDKHDRTGTGTLSLFGETMEFDLTAGKLPIVTTKKVNYKAIFNELKWFLSGSTDVSDLVDMGTNIWLPDSYRWYKKKCEERGIPALESQAYTNKVLDIAEGRAEANELFCDLGPIYGAQWRNFNGEDQIKNLIDGINKDPHGRRHLVTAWNPADLGDMALPPCHMFFQVNLVEIPYEERIQILQGRYDNGNSVGGMPRDFAEGVVESEVPKYYLDLMMYQRSCDFFLGVPFNITSYALLAHMIGACTKSYPRNFKWVGGDVHIYKNHIDQMKLQLGRQPYESPTILVNQNKKYPWEFGHRDISMGTFQTHPFIKGSLSVGV